MEKIVCPYCFEEFQRCDVMFRCGNSSCDGKAKDDALSQFWRVDRIMPPALDNELGTWGRMRDKMPDQATCPTCGRTAYNTICPVCHNVIPKEMVERKGKIISIIGARSSGKTNYITVLIDQLKKNGRKLGPGFGMLASTVADRKDDRTAIKYKTDFYDVLFTNHTVPAATAISDRKSKVPLIYTIRQDNLKERLHLVFYDTAGENFNDPSMIEENAEFLKRSDAVIFLLDTFSIPYVHDKLGMTSEIEHPIEEIIENINGYFSERVDKRTKEEFFRKPVAFAFSKFDALLRHEAEFGDMCLPGISLDQNSAFLDGRGVDFDDMRMVSEGIKAALTGDEYWAEGNFASCAGDYKNHLFFGFSSLGKDPEGDGTIKDIKPYRVLDPIVWALGQLGYPLLKRK